MYDFRTLSPLDFEELVRDLLQAAEGLRFESFGPGSDLGMDFRFASATGKAIVQAKHYAGSGFEPLLRTARKEDSKVAKLKPARYIFATSVSLTPHQKRRLQEAMPSAPLRDCDILGRSDLNNLLRMNPDIERKHFKLWLASTAVLERILRSGVYNRTQVEMDVIKAMVPKFVQNQSVPLAERILEKHGVLIISGEPGVGKTTLAQMLVWLHAEQDWRITVIDDIVQGFEVDTEGSKNLIFFDDFLGQVRISADLIRGMDQRFPPFIQRIKHNKDLRFILTTRDYIFHQAQAQSSRLAAPNVGASEFVLNVGHYTRAVRAQMLYNHIYFSDINGDEREELIADDYFLKIIDHKNFNPRLIEFLTSADYLSITGLTVRRAVERVLENPEALWEVPYRHHISSEGRALMLALFFNKERTSVTALERSFSRMIQIVERNLVQAELPAKFRSALRELEGSVLSIQDRQVTFANPGLRDYLRGVVASDRLLPAASRAVTEFDELKQAWTIRNARDFASTDLGSEDDWVRAARRMVEDGSGSTLRRLMLTIEMYDQYPVDTLAQCMTAIASELVEAEFEYDECQMCCDALEALSDSVLPQDIMDSTRQSLSLAVAGMLRQNGDVLSLDDIQSVSAGLARYGSEELAFEATCEALTGYVKELNSTLDEVHSLEELNSLSCELRPLLREYGIPENRMDDPFEYREQALLEQDDGDQDRYRGYTKSAKLEISDAQIKSMFMGLRKGKR